MFWKKDDPNGLNQPIPPGWDITELGLLGQGGMSRVFRVRDEALGREVALKVLKPDLLKDDDAVVTFIDEAAITAQLDHPNVPPVYALMVEFMAYSGLRTAEVTGLEVGDLVFAPGAGPLPRCTVQVRRTKKRKGGAWVSGRHCAPARLAACRDRWIRPPRASPRQSARRCGRA